MRHAKPGRSAALAAAPASSESEARPAKTPVDQASLRRERRRNSLRYRLRHQARPHYLMGSMLVAATAARIAVNATGETALVLGTVAAVVFTAALLAMVLGRNRIAAAQRRWAAACTAGAAGWLTLATGAGFSTETVALLLVGGMGLALPHWKRHRIPNPSSTPLATPESVRSEPTTVPELWADRISGKDGVLPGSYLTEREEFKHGERFTIQLVGGKQTFAHALAALAMIAGGLVMPEDQVVIERHQTRIPSLASLTVVHSSPVAKKVPFPGPSAFNAETGIVNLGPFIDGEGHAPWRLYTENSMWGGYLVGATGSGKSRTMAVLAAAARSGSNTVVWYGDPSEGASSGSLARHANATARGPDTIRNALSALTRLMILRQAENALYGLEGFTPTAQRPGVLFFIDECQDAFCDELTQALATDVARKGRKVGIALVAASQVATLDAFGKGPLADALRSSILAGNAVAFHSTSNNTKNVMPGLLVDPCTLPAIPGYAFLVDRTQTGRSAPFRSFYLDERDAEALFLSLPPDTLEPGEANACGSWYLKRHDREERDAARLRNTIEALRAGKWPAASGSAASEKTPTSANTAAGNLVALPKLPAVPKIPGPLGHPAGAGPEFSTRPESGGYVAVLEGIRAGHSTPAALRKLTGYGETHVGNLLKALLDDGRITKVGHGRYVTSDAAVNAS